MSEAFNSKSEFLEAWWESKRRIHGNYDRGLETYKDFMLAAISGMEAADSCGEYSAQNVVAHSMEVADEAIYQIAKKLNLTK